MIVQQQIERNPRVFQFVLSLAVLLAFLPGVHAELDTDAWHVFGFEGEKILNLFACVLAAALSALIFLAYKKSRKQGLLLVSAAFAIFSIKAFLMGAELLFGEWSWVDQVTSLMDFAILLLFFMGVVRR